MSTFLAVDFGAGSGRVIAGRVSGGQLELDELHRFPNRQVRLGGHVYWDFPSLFEEMKEGLRRAAAKYADVESIGIDTWGVDYGLVDRAGNLMGNPLCYRDASTADTPAEVFARIDEAAHYAETGIQVMPINTMFQLYARKKENEAWLREARHLLFMPDLFAYYLTGIPGNEYCIASTSELLDARRRTWNMPLIRELGLPEHLFGELLEPGTFCGMLCPEVAAEVGLSPGVKVVAVGSHDTASAVHAVPFRKGKEAVSAFLSSGTWSLLGVALDEPVLTEEARRAGFTNEGGVGGHIRFLQNITGLWILQCLVRQWDTRGWRAGYDFLIAEAEQAADVSSIDVDAPDFKHPADMEKAICGLLPGPGNESAGHAGRICALRVAVVGRALPDGDTTNERLVAPARGVPACHRRRMPQPLAQPSDGRGYGYSSTGRPSRGYGHRQPVSTSRSVWKNQE